MRKRKFTILLSTLLVCTVAAQNRAPISLLDFSDGINHWFLEVRDTSYKRHTENDYIGIANNLIAYQNEDGGWPKNIDWLGILNTDSVKAALSERYKQSTFDNRNIFPQIEYLAQVYAICKEEKYKTSVERGLAYVFTSQNKSGGWRGWDVDAITFNDDVMTGIMTLLLNIKTQKEQFLWLDGKTKKRAAKSFNKALDLTLRCQVTINGQKTAWGQQHDHNTLEPVKARTFELPGLTANESTSVLSFLMSIPNPDKRIIESVEAGVQWLQKSAITGIRIDTFDVPEGTYPGLTLKIDRKESPDPTAGPLWARFYEIDTNRPFMCTRQGEKVYSLNDVNPERRAGYAWYGTWPKILLNETYPAWQSRLLKK
jgi:PelA/Pel-15E family pectate lyase